DVYKRQGTGSLLIDSVKFVGRNSLEFNISNTCPIVLPGSSCNLIFSTHYLSNNPKKTSLVISSNAENFPFVEIPITASSPVCTSGSLTLNELSKTINREGGTFTNFVSRTGESSCLWLSTDSASWLATHLTSSGLEYSVQENTTNSLRMTSAIVGGEVFTVIQHKDTNNTTFNDISGNYFENYINAIYSQRITIGCIQDVSFCPLGLVTRGEMAAFIIRALQGENFNYTFTPYFTDVPSNHNFFKYVQKMRDLGITVVSGEYRINDRVTRGEMAAFIIRAIFGENFTFTQTPYFGDVPSNHTFFKYVQKMRDLGITVVTGTYRVDDYVTRQEMAAFLGRAFLNMR
ncbi:MAG: S-layer homology domain-containing protein, partial [Thermodesulfovibrionales bacterium]|nr:S-layer homology domain-containing protein [Thermodesulfovibrionales bacterium]